MRACLALLVLAVLVAAPSAAAQTTTPTPTPTPTVTPTPTPTPTPEEIEEAERQEQLRKRKIVRRVYADFRRDGRIDNCDHSRTALKRTLESITDEFDADFPDFREAVRAAIKDHDKERCEEEAEPTPTATPNPSATPAPTVTPAPTTPPATDDGDLPDLGGGGGGGGGGGNDGGGGGGGSFDPEPTVPPSESDITPVQPEATPAPTTPPAATEPQLAVTSPEGDPSLLIPALLLAAALAGLGLLGASALAARRGGRLEGWGHALREAGYRATGAWGDFGDWLRLGR